MHRDTKDHRVKFNKGIRPKREDNKETSVGISKLIKFLGSDNSTIYIWLSEKNQEEKKTFEEMIKSQNFTSENGNKILDDIIKCLMKEKKSVRRFKRSTIDSLDSHMSTIMGELEDKLHGLEVKF